MINQLNNQLSRLKAYEKSKKSTSFAHFEVEKGRSKIEGLFSTRFWSTIGIVNVRELVSFCACCMDRVDVGLFVNTRVVSMYEHYHENTF